MFLTPGLLPSYSFHVFRFVENPLPKLLIWNIYGPNMEMVWDNIWLIYGHCMVFIWDVSSHIKPINSD